MLVNNKVIIKINPPNHYDSIFNNSRFNLLLIAAYTKTYGFIYYSSTKMFTT